ncbi:MAG: hypothetical protein R3F42_03300 [Pseudomonadota bacterium]
MAACGLLVHAVGCTSGDPGRPAFVEQMIAQLRDSEQRNPPAQIWRYAYKGMAVYYVTPYCCDVPGELYDDAGKYICAPDGGIDGRGDGRCPEFYRERRDAALVWADPR